MVRELIRQIEEQLFFRMRKRKWYRLCELLFLVSELLPENKRKCKDTGVKIIRIVANRMYYAGKLRRKSKGKIYKYMKLWNVELN